MIRVLAKPETLFRHHWTFSCPRCESTVHFVPVKMQAFRHKCPDCAKDFSVMLSDKLAA